MENFLIIFSLYFSSFLNSPTRWCFIIWNQSLITIKLIDNRASENTAKPHHTEHSYNELPDIKKKCFVHTMHIIFCG